MASKSKEFQKLFYQESQGIQQPKISSKIRSLRKQELAAYQRFKDNLERNQDNKKTIFVDKPKGIRKMSEVLEEFINPYIDDDDPYEERDFLIQMAIVAWNCAVFPEEQRTEMLEAFLENIANPFDAESLQTKKSLRSLIEELIQYKLENFDRDKRIIKDYQLIEHEMAFHLSVAYTIV